MAKCGANRGDLYHRSTTGPLYCVLCSPVIAAIPKPIVGKCGIRVRDIGHCISQHGCACLSPLGSFLPPGPFALRYWDFFW
jgi:hypothetical protein